MESTYNSFTALKKISPYDAVRILNEYNSKDGLLNRERLLLLASESNSLGVEFYTYDVPILVFHRSLSKDKALQQNGVKSKALLAFMDYYCETKCLVFAKMLYEGCESKPSYQEPFPNIEQCEHILNAMYLSIRRNLRRTIVPLVFATGYQTLRTKMRDVDKFYFCNLVYIDPALKILNESDKIHIIDCPKKFLEKLPFDLGYMHSIYAITKFAFNGLNFDDTGVNLFFASVTNDILKFYLKVDALKIPELHKHDNDEHNYNIIWKDKLVVTPREVEEKFLSIFKDIIDVKFLKNFATLQLLYDNEKSVYFQKFSKIKAVAFEKLFNPKRWFNSISVLVYKALISRSRAKYDGSHAYMLSRKTIEDIVFLILYNTHWLMVQSKIEINETESKKFNDFLVEHAKNDMKEYRSLFESDASYIKSMRFMFKCMSAFGTEDEEYDYDPYPVNETDNFRLLDLVFYMFYDNDDEYMLIGNISKAIDLAHDRGPLAGCFVEGGAETCKAVSNMESNAFFEESDEIEDGIYLFENMNNFKKMFNLKFWH